MSNEERKPWEQSFPYTSPTGKETTLYYIGTLAEALGRTPQSIRKWEINGVLPPTPFKKGRKRLYSEEHIDAIVHWAEECHLSMGSKAKYKQSKFSRHVYKEFQRIHEEFFGKGEDVNEDKEE